MGPRKLHTGRQYLELAQKKGFEPKSIETFSLEAVDVKDVKQIEVRSLIQCENLSTEYVGLSSNVFSFYGINILIFFGCFHRSTKLLSCKFVSYSITRIP